MEVIKRREICQRFAQPPMLFKIFLSSENNLVFAKVISMHVMLLNGKAFLSILGTAT